MWTVFDPETLSQVTTQGYEMLESRPNQYFNLYFLKKKSLFHHSIDYVGRNVPTSAAPSAFSC